VPMRAPEEAASRPPAPDVFRHGWKDYIEDCRWFSDRIKGCLCGAQTRNWT
jgi:hypothetical protein